jgi:hypothetical protein
MPLDKITVDSISPNAVSNIAIANGTIVSVDLGDQSVTGPKIGVRAISTNNFSSNVFVANVTANIEMCLPIFADNTARDATITSPRAGLVAFVTSGTQFQGYTGSGWIVLN